MGTVTTMEPKQTEANPMFLGMIWESVLDLSLEVKKLSDAMTRFEEKLDAFESQSVNRSLGR